LQTVRPMAGGYMVPAEGPAPGGSSSGASSAPGPSSRGSSRSSWGFCCSRPLDPKAQAMSYIGVGKGDYIVETRYRYVGGGEGEFSLIDEPEDPARPPPDDRGCCWTWCPVVLVCALVLLICGWLFLPEQDVQLADIEQKLGVASTSLPSSPSGAASASGGDVERSKLFISMMVRNVDYSALHANKTLDWRFTTEVQEGIAVVAGSGILPDNVTVSLSPGSVRVHAYVAPPAMANIAHLRSRLASESEQVGDGVKNSLLMINGVESVCIGDIDVTDVEVSLVVAHAPKTTTVTTTSTASGTVTLTATRTVTATRTKKTADEEDSD